MTTAQHNMHHIRRWPASYYFPVAKKWISAQQWSQGTLLVDYAGLTFYQRTDRKEPLRRILFADITEIRKATSTMIFAALVISVKNDTHWFSSLSNRDAAYVIIEHFWRERLIPLNRSPGLICDSQQTKLGTELLKIAEDSQSTLQAAGTMLHQQGEQLDRSMGVMTDIENDLSVAERFISSFESWMGNWRLPKNQSVNEPLDVVDSKSIARVHSFPVLYAAWSDGAGSAMRNGVLHISRDGITVLDQAQQHVCHYRQTEVSAVRVLSPWELTVSQYLIGQPDRSYLLLSTHMVHVLKALTRLYKDRMDLVEPAPGLQPVPIVEAVGPLFSQHDSGDLFPPECILPLDSGARLPHHDVTSPGGTTQVQLATFQKATEVVSDAEAQELIDVVARMKSMAMDIGNEQAAQLEKIDTLTLSTDQVNDRVKCDTARIKRLL